jgi:hypothetical protein
MLDRTLVVQVLDSPVNTSNEGSNKDNECEISAEQQSITEESNRARTSKDMTNHKLTNPAQPIISPSKMV